MAIEIISDSKGSMLDLNSEVSKLLSFARSLVVNTEDACTEMTTLYRKAREWKKCVEEKRKEMTEPMRKRCSQINDHAKTITEPLDEVIDLANGKTCLYLQQCEKTALEEESKIREMASLFGDGEIYIPKAEIKLKGDMVTLMTQLKCKFKIVDASKIPSKYLKVDEEAIQRDIDLGIVQIDGVEVYEEKTTKLRIK